MPRPHDLLIRNATIIDGSGAPRFDGDIAIRGDRIVAIGATGSLGAAAQEIDAQGMVAAPGFIDTHTHDDRILLAGPEMRAKVSQGVTTVVAGNCGISLAPMPRPVPQPVPPPLDLLDREGGWYRYARFADYLNALRAAPAAVNAACMVGHTTLRAITMPDLSRPADAAQIAAMQALVAEAMAAGAIGVSTGLAYAPAAAATTDEVVAVCGPMAGHDGLYATHMRDESGDSIAALEESFAVGRALGVQVLISHHKLAGVECHGRSVETLALIDRHRHGVGAADGVGAAVGSAGVSLDCYPYTASSTVLTAPHAESSPRTVIAWSRPCPEAAGRALSDLMAEWGMSLAEAVARLQPAGAIYFRMHEDDVRRILTYGPTMIGSDGLPHDERPHPRLWGTFPRVLGHYSRDLGLMPLELAVHKMTGLAAAELGLPGRGLLGEGMFADLTLFDADTVIDRASFDDPTAPAAGIAHVIVNGQPVWADGAPTGARPGQVLRRDRHATMW